MFNPLDHSLFLMTPEHLQGGDHAGHVPFAMALVQMVRPRGVVALGVGDGDVYLALCQAVAALGLPARCAGVDARLTQELRSDHDARYAGFSRLATTLEPSSEAIDLLVIDPSRDSVDAAATFARCRSRLSARGVVVVLDIVGHGSGARLWQELSAERPSFRFEHDGGLGVIAVGSDVPEPIAALAALDAAAASTLRAWCAQLGAAVRMPTQRQLRASLDYADYADALLSEVLGSVSFRAGMVATAPARRVAGELAAARTWLRRKRADRTSDGATVESGDPGVVQRLKELATRPTRVCLFSHFDRDGVVDDYVVAYLEALRRCGLEIVFVSTAATLGRDSFDRVAAVCAAVLLRRNIGLDFGSWRAALDAYPWLVDGELLVIANDSVYGPLEDLTQLFAAMNARPCDFWGMTEARQPSTHLQSYFVAFKQRCLASDAFRAFFADVRFLSDKQQVIDRYELTLARRLQASGLAWAAVAPGVELGGRNLNPMHQLWRSTLDAGVPFVKIELLRDNPLHADLRGWEPMLRERFGYDTGRIIRHLRRIQPDAAALRATRT